MVFPSTVTEFLHQAQSLRSRIAELKKSVAVPDYGWYPYDSLTVVSLLHDLIRDDYPEKSA